MTQTNHPMGDGVSAVAQANRPAWQCACAVCMICVASAPAYFTRAFGNPHHFAATSEGIADALGFCPRHGAELMSGGSSRRAIAQVFEGVIPQVLPLLQERHFGDEKFQQVYFSAHWACPACSYEHRAAGRHAARLGRQHFGAVEASEAAGFESICFEYFQALARGLKPELRMPVLAHYGEVLDHAARAVEALLASGVPREADPGELPALAHALSLTAGPPAVAASTSDTPLAEALQACAGLEQALSRDNACPVCVEVERARQRWLAAVPLAASYQLDDWLFFPTCPAHVSTIAGLGDAQLTAAVAAHALHVATEHLHQQLRLLVRSAETQEERAAARIAHWGRRPRRKKSESPRPSVSKLARCAACERLAIAELHATGRLLRLLPGNKHRQAFEAGYGLCMKHHAQAYLLAPKGVVRTLLSADQVRRLTEFMRWLKDETSGLAPNQAASAPHYQLALRRFCGFG